MNLSRFGLLALLISLSLSACKGQSDTAKADTPKADTPKADTPKADTSKVETVIEDESKSAVVAKRVYFSSPKDGAELKSPVQLTFAVDGMSVRPAGEDVTDKTSGHHHLIIDAEGIPAGQVVPMDKQHIHYGKGQTAAKVELAPGKHTLRLQFADGAHLSYGPEMSAQITVNITE